MLGNHKSLKKALCSSAAIALISAAGLTVASDDANATASAYAALEVHAMAISFSSGSLGDIGVDDVTGGGAGGFTAFNFFLTGLSATHTGLVGSPLSSANVGTGTITTSGATLDQAQLCLVDCTGFTDNDYVSGASGAGNATSIISGAANHAVSDSNMLNTVLNGSARFGTQAGASSQGGGTLATGGVLSGNTMNWNFSTDADDDGKTMDLTWLENRLVELETTKDDEAANANFNFIITLINRDGTQVSGGGDNSQTLFNLQPSVFTPGGSPTTQEDINDIDASVSLGADGTLGFLDGDTDYSLVFTFNSFASATSNFVPEPGAIGLLGAGLLGLGALRHRRRQKKA